MFNLNKLHFWLIFSPLILSAVMVLFIISILKFLPPLLPLFYSLPWGEGQLGTHQQFLIIPASISLITLLNLLISWQLHASQSFFQKVLLFSPILVSFIFTITLIKTVANFL